jgi:DNA helicase MCM8
VGDPGLGKSQMLTSCASVAPRGVFVSGNTTTSAGLTVTLTKETAGEYTIDAGALVLADQGKRFAMLLQSAEISFILKDTFSIH